MFILSYYHSNGQRGYVSNTHLIIIFKLFETNS